MPWCPNCKAEYVPEVPECPHCNEALVDVDPNPPEPRVRLISVLEVATICVLAPFALSAAEGLFSIAALNGSPYLLLVLPVTFVLAALYGYCRNPEECTVAVTLGTLIGLAFRGAVYLALSNVGASFEIWWPFSWDMAPMCFLAVFGVWLGAQVRWGLKCRAARSAQLPRE